MLAEPVLEKRPALVRLHAADIPLKAPLQWPILAPDGAVLFDSGTVVPDETARAFLYRHFEPHRPSRETALAPASLDANADGPPTLEDIGLAIGGRVGLRGGSISGSAMYASRVIGFSNPRRNGERSLFVTQPVMTGVAPLELTRGEQVDLVALTGRGVFRFACTVDATSREPFNYVVLSAPGAIRRLRARKFARLPTRLGARFSNEAAANAIPQLGRVADISPYGMSLSVPTATASAGDRLRLSFRFSTDGVDVQIDTTAIVRHVGTAESGAPGAAYGLEFEALDPSQRIALKSFMAEHS
ncbi:MULTISPECIES: flagellar brake protein [unclassified Caballeronia]|uniref:flagellar brake protein n=1 Tax=unclassified Caballeronia TaxID=2646786 RepID=UPI0028544D6F|nr:MULTISPECIES: flagellar brake protein [unclassified Caballeronia]MDR5739394.1 flagellar brake protein [Caballeronia sp. LZ016]MDR5807882.1 flagellar brake protein [Caballeronia sp. LZ019]